jgi:hypothetical protein
VNNDTPNPSPYGQINSYNGATGAPIGSGVFAQLASGGLIQPREIVFDPTGANMYVVSSLGCLNLNDTYMGQVLRFQGPAGQNPGAYVEAYISGGQGGLNRPIGLARDAAGDLYVSDRDTANVTRFAPNSQAAFTVTLDSASTSPVSVNYATADATAIAGTDYTQTPGTLVFAPGVTSETVNVPITTVATGGPTKTFTMNLYGASGATISRAQGTGNILNRQTKFFVVDSGTVKTYQYGSGGTSEEITAPYYTTDTAPRGDASTAAGTTVWVVDANKTVYVYDNHGVLQGSWSPGGLSRNANLTGIATNGTNIWLVDSSSAKVYKYTGAASRLSGSQNAASSFSLASGKNGDSNPQDIVTDGTSIWVVDGTALKVFKYTLSGSLLGSWSIDPANTHPTGITIDPANVSDIWIVDNGTDKVYQYIGAASRTSGSQNAGATFALNPYDTNPQGIADPPPADQLLRPAVAADALGEPSAVAMNAVPRMEPSAITGVPTLATNRDAVFALMNEVYLDGRPASDSLASGVPTTRVDQPTSAADLFGGQKPLDPWTRFTTGNTHAGHSGHSAPGRLASTWADEGNEESMAAADFLFAGLAGDMATEP